MQNKIDRITFHNEWWDALKFLSNDDRLNLLDTFFKFVFDDVEPSYPTEKAFISLMLSLAEVKNDNE